MARRIRSSPVRKGKADEYVGEHFMRQELVLRTKAKAHYLLEDLDLGQAGSALRQAGQIIFEEFGGSPANSFTWVELRDDLTVSLLQARLIELNLPINVAVGTRD